MRAVRRLLILLTCASALAISVLALSGCGSGNHYLGGVAAHGIANHFVHSRAGQRRVNKAFCLYHGHRVLVDLRTHHLIGAGLNGLSAFHACKGGFGRRH